ENLIKNPGFTGIDLFHPRRADHLGIEQTGIDPQPVAGFGAGIPMGDAAAGAAAVKVDMLAVPGIGVGGGYRGDLHVSLGEIGPEHAIAAAKAAIAMGDLCRRVGDAQFYRAAMTAAEDA